MAIQSAVVLPSNRLTPVKYGLDPFQLLDSESTVDLRNAVVVTEFSMLEPILHIASSLVAKFSSQSGDLRVLSDDDSALSGRDLLVGIESENACISLGPNFSSVVLRPNGLARV